jgi:HAD superfamily hydrolase (TIGR01509 family)
VQPPDSRFQPRALIFDLDGVIVHSMPLHNRAWDLYLRRHGIVEVPAAIDARMHGRHNAEILRAFFGNGLPPEEIARRSAEKEELYRNLMRPRLGEFLVPGVAEFVKRWRRLPLAVASNAEPANVEFVLEDSGLRPCFRAVVDAHQVERPKPAPDVYLLAARLLGEPPERCLVFEDSETGVRAARASGARVVGLGTTTARLDGCDLLIADFLDPALSGFLDAGGGR